MDKIKSFLKKLFNKSTSEPAQVSMSDGEFVAKVLSKHEQPIRALVELYGSTSALTSIIVLLSFIRFCLNNGIKKEITIRIGYNKPNSVPCNFAVNDEIIPDRYPDEVVDVD